VGDSDNAVGRVCLTIICDVGEDRVVDIVGDGRRLGKQDVAGSAHDVGIKRNREFASWCSGVAPIGFCLSTG